MDIATIGLDLAKIVFQLHALNPSGRTVLQASAPHRGVVFFRTAAGLPGWHRGLLGRALLGETSLPTG
ncbi:hypothetical protein R52603_02112 [Paraburkholderia saeva]|nr:hypothetical protein R52603_02112 [Paraburkholderia saeva]